MSLLQMDYEQYGMPHDVSAMSALIFEKMSDSQKKFDKALDQIGALELQLRDLETRYKRAVKHKKNSFRYNLRLKLSVVTGIKMMYNHYASKKAGEIRVYTRQLEVLYGNEMQQGANSRQDHLAQDNPDTDAPGPSEHLRDTEEASPSNGSSDA